MSQELPILDVPLNLPVDHLSPSQIAMFQRCPLQYWHRYVEKIVVPPGVALVEGSSHHAALETNNEHKRKKKRDMQPKKVIECFCDEFTTRKAEIVDWEGETTDSVLSRGEVLLKKYMSGFARRVEPKLIEHEVTLQIGDVPVFGVIDVVADLLPSPADALSGKKAQKPMSDVVIDYKVVSKLKSEQELNESLQLAFYGWAVQLLTKKKDTLVAFCNLKKGNTPGVECQFSHATVDRLKWLRYVVYSTARAISAGAFPPCDPTNWCCNPRWCGYYAMCKGQFESKTKKGR